MMEAKIIAQLYRAKMFLRTLEKIHRIEGDMYEQLGNSDVSKRTIGHADSIHEFVSNLEKEII